MIKNDSDTAQIMDDLFIRLNIKGLLKEKGETSSLEILQGELRTQEWFAGAKEIYNYILECCGLSPQSDTTSMKTTSEIYAQQKTSSETIGLLRQLRADTWTRHLDKALIMFGLWDGKKDRPYSFSIPDEENMNKSLELEEAKGRIEANLSNPISEIAKIYGVSKKEAEKILQENIAVNKRIFDQTKGMRLEQEGDSKEKKVDKNE